VVGLDAEQEVPILHLRLRKAAARGARIVVVHPRRTRLHDVAGHILCRPGDEGGILDEIREGVADTPAGRVGAALREAGNDGVLLVGSRLLDQPGAGDAAVSAATATGARIGLVSRRANDHGALRAGVHPVLLPGGRPITAPEDRAEVESIWGPILNGDPGRNATEILEACARREIDVLFLVGVDPLRDVPDASLARRALENVAVKVVQSLELGSLEPFADAFLPAAAPVEKDGHFTTWEGRGQRIRPLRASPGIALPDWEIFASMALACGGDLGFESLEELQEELGTLLEPRESVPETATASPSGPAPEGLRLFTYPLLVDEGRLSGRADELKAALEEPAFVELHPADAAAAGILDGARAIVRTDAGSAELPARVTEAIARGAVFVPFNQPGLAANSLLSGTFVTSATVEAVDAPEESPEAEAVQEVSA
jgi:NADH-quinone oxidoreductase subunit G